MNLRVGELFEFLRRWFAMTEKKQYLPYGKHLIVELFDCPFDKLDNEGIIKELIPKCIALTGCKPLEVVTHKFQPQGVTGIGILEESHIAIHTSPEWNYCAVDIYTCGESANPWKCLPLLIDIFSPKKVAVKEVERPINVELKIREN